MTLRVGDRRVARTVVRVGRGGPSAGAAPPTVLATGDSTMQGIDGFLADELGDAATVVSDVRIGTGLSKSDQPALPAAGDPPAIQWALLAAMQVARERPERDRRVARRRRGLRDDRARRRTRAVLRRAVDRGVQPPRCSS